MDWKIYLTALTTFFAIDMVWLGFVAKNLYAKQIGFLLKPNVNWVAALLFYALYIAGLTFFVITPALQKHSWMYAALAGAFFGLICYATYDLTNLATVKNWPIVITVIDLIWGTILAAAVSLVTYMVMSKKI